MSRSIKVCNKLISYYNLGRISYEKAATIQEELVNRQLLSDQHPARDLNGPSGILLLVEHEPVYTVGMRKNEYTEIDEQSLRDKGAQFHRTNRGGLITFHGPGQLVAYPILNLQNFKPSIRWYVCQLEEVLINTCREFGIESKRTENTGIWIDRAKIAAIGLRCRKYVVSHGVALNCNTDLHWFDHIVPCGLEGYTVTSLTKERKKLTTIQEVIPVFLEQFSKTFQINLVSVSAEDLQLETFKKEIKTANSCLADVQI